MFQPVDSTGLLIEVTMKVLVARPLGFCGGVERAVKIASDAIGEAERMGRKLYFFGRLVHNDEVCRSFGKIRIIDSPDEAENGSVVIIRAHGITDAGRKALLEKNIGIVDCTCPVVLMGQKKVREAENDVIIFGYRGHSEVASLVGSSRKKVHVVSGEEDLSGIPAGRYDAVVQTTFSDSLLSSLLEKAGEKGIIVSVLNSICRASTERRESVMRLLDRVDGFVVVGDSASANSRELEAIVSGHGVRCWMTDGTGDMDPSFLALDTVGLTAGASTPKEVYGRVIEKLEAGICQK